MSKGSGRRPSKVSDDKVQEAWERIFKTTEKLREKNGKDESDTVKPKASKREWLDNTSDC